jgi:hypothetical protein
MARPGAVLGILPLLLLPLLPALPAASAQAEALYDFSMTVDASLHVVQPGDFGRATVTLKDRSHDSPQGFVPGTSGGVLFHTWTFQVAPGFNESRGWIPTGIGSVSTDPGQTVTQVFQVQVTPQAVNPYYKAQIRATIVTAGGTFNRTADVLFFSKGVVGFTALPGRSVDSLQPLEIKQVSLSIFNQASVKRTFDIGLTDNACGLAVGPPATTVVPPKTFQEIQFSIQGPDSRFNPLSDDNCVLGFAVHAQDNPGQALTVILPVKVTGTYFDPLGVFYVLAAIALLILLALFLRRRKERLEEEILGKPQKPWTIPVEQVYLRHLKAKDQRAWYVVRHYLMEDEYRSALLWYRAYKKATRGDRRKERLVLAQERSYARWKAGWENAIAKPVAKADRFEAKLQRKLDRRARKAHRKATRKWRKQVRRLEAGHLAKAKRAAALHAKLVARARKKGLPEPEPLQTGPPELPPQPAPRPRPLAEHRWARKAARQRKRMLRKQGNLEVRFERADARKQLQLQRRVEKLSRDIGDAGFVAQHATQQQ